MHWLVPSFFLTAPLITECWRVGTLPHITNVQSQKLQNINQCNIKYKKNWFKYMSTLIERKVCTWHSSSRRHGWNKGEKKTAFWSNYHPAVTFLCSYFPEASDRAPRTITQGYFSEASDNSQIGGSHHYPSVMGHQFLPTQLSRTLSCREEMNAIAEL